MNTPYPSYPGDDQTGGPSYAHRPPTSHGARPVPPMAPYASWGSRVGAILLDGLIGSLIAAVPIVAGIVTVVLTVQSESFDPVTGAYENGSAGSLIGYLLIGLGYFVALGFSIWNNGIRQGKTGQSIGKGVLGIYVIRHETGQYLGAGAGSLRWLLAQILGGFCFVNYLWPLWDDKNQTWHDKVVGSVVVCGT